MHNDIRDTLVFIISMVQSCGSNNCYMINASEDLRDEETLTSLNKNVTKTYTPEYNKTCGRILHHPFLSKITSYQVEDRHHLKINSAVTGDRSKAACFWFLLHSVTAKNKKITVVPLYHK